jgi:hypothetical protein
MKLSLPSKLLEKTSLGPRFIVLIKIVIPSYKFLAIVLTRTRRTLQITLMFTLFFLNLISYYENLQIQNYFTFEFLNFFISLFGEISLV